jgi:hypothetical protein
MGAEVPTTTSAPIRSELLSIPPNIEERFQSLGRFPVFSTVYCCKHIAISESRPSIYYNVLSSQALNRDVFLSVHPPVQCLHVFPNLLDERGNWKGRKKQTSFPHSCAVIAKGPNAHVCVCVSLSLCVCVCVCVCVCARAWPHALCLCAYPCDCVSMHVTVYVCVHTCVSLNMRWCLRSWMGTAQLSHRHDGPRTSTFMWQGKIAIVPKLHLNLLQVLSLQQ